MKISCLQFELMEEVKLHFYSSHPPCGDATIAPKDDDSNDIHRTGAKCPEDLELTDRSGSSYHALGAVRTKPGRGDPTCSLSCSDKMAKWNLVGLQGSLVAAVTASPVSGSTITVGGESSIQPLERALIKRLEGHQETNCEMKLFQSKIPFQIKS